jgi:hypothetical protein
MKLKLLLSETETIDETKLLSQLKNVAEEVFGEDHSQIAPRLAPDHFVPAMKWAVHAWNEGEGQDVTEDIDDSLVSELEETIKKLTSNPLNASVELDVYQRLDEALHKVGDAIHDIKRVIDDAHTVYEFISDLQAEVNNPQDALTKRAAEHGMKLMGAELF